MQNRIDKLFSEKKENILSVFFTAGFPKLNDTLPIIEELDKIPVDLIEIGIPFSDPVADGPIIQQSSALALQNGMDLTLLFQQLQALRQLASIPVLLMGYINPILKFGIESFYIECYKTGIDGLIIPDLPLNEYVEFHKPLAEKYNIHVVFLISPETKPERIKLIDDHSKGFLYLVSSNATTGTNKGVNENLNGTINNIRNLQLKNPIIMGFGIRGQKEFSRACEMVNGAIIGTSFVEILANSKELKKDIPDFINSILLKQETL